MPAANIIAIQLAVLNSGSSLSWPSLIRPNRLNPMNRMNRTKIVPATM